MLKLFFGFPLINCKSKTKSLLFFGTVVEKNKTRNVIQKGGTVIPLLVENWVQVQRGDEQTPRPTCSSDFSFIHLREGQTKFLYASFTNATMQ